MSKKTKPVNDAPALTKENAPAPEQNAAAPEQQNPAPQDGASAPEQKETAPEQSQKEFKATPRALKKFNLQNKGK